MKKIINMAIIIIVIFAIASIGYFLLSDKIQESKLRNEVKKISQMTFPNDELNTNIITKGEYAIIEDLIKDYINKYNDLSEEIKSILNDEKILYVLTGENYKNDGPNFIVTKEYIYKTKTRFNKKIDILLETTDQEKMIDVAKKRGLSDDSLELYKELMFGKNNNTDFEKMIEQIKKSSEDINKMINSREKIIDFLIENKDKWSIDDEEGIVFETIELLNSYNELLGEL